MSTLNLPKPVHSYAGQDELRSANPSSAKPDDRESDEKRPSDSLKVGVIYPPAEIRKIIDKTASHTAKSSTPSIFEDKIRQAQKADPRFAFLNDDDPYNRYYRWQIARMKEDAQNILLGIKPAQTESPGSVGGATGGGDGRGVSELGARESRQEDVGGAYEPKEWEFKVDLPGVTAMDLDILRLTALFHARRGRSFLSSLSIREGRNYQFDFLRPTHSLYGYYNRMVESYQKILQPPPGLIETLVKESSDPLIRWKTLEEARNRAKWERGRRRREDERAKEKDEEALAFAAIDWQDFVTVETIEFTQSDVDLNLPPPTTVEKLKTMSMAEKRMASMVMEETGMGPVGGNEGVQPQQQQQQQQQQQAEEMEIEEDDEDEEDEEIRLQRIKAEQEQARAREVQRAALESKGLKIKKDYVPKGLQRAGQVAMQKCPYCNQSIPESELSEHIRIELLDPKWKEQKSALEARRNQHLQLATGADISASLRSLAAARTDLFGDELDEAERKKKEEEEKAKRKEREKIIWDGHTNSAAKVEQTFQTKFSAEDQIRKIHERLGVGENPANSVGPQAGPGIPTKLPPPLAAGLPTPSGSTAFSGASISALPTAPTGPSSSSTPSSSTLPIHPSLPLPPHMTTAVSGGASPSSVSTPTGPASMSPLPTGPAGSGPSIHPARAAVIAGTTRPRSTDDDADAIRASTSNSALGQQNQQLQLLEQQRAMFKRPKVDSTPVVASSTSSQLPQGQLYSEVDWQSLHPEPMTISVQLPSMPERPEWKLDGSIISIPDILVGSTTFSALRERIKRAVDADLPISRIRLDVNGKVMNNANSLASVNLGPDDLVVMSIRKK